MNRLVIAGALACCSLAQVAWTRQPAAAPVANPGEMRSEVFYHVFQRSFRDGNGDGVGDLPGLVASLGYLQQLGITSLLLTPLYPSPFYHGYFASQFEGVDPAYGTPADFAALVAAVHARGMKIFLDEEFQYVSYEHPWYSSGLGHPESPFSSFLIWHGAGNTQPEAGPFGITITGHFPAGTTGITTVNLKAPAFKAWAAQYLRSWVDPDGDGDFSDGVDGFRLDHMMDDLDDKGILPGLFADFWVPLIAQTRQVNPRVRFIAEQSDWGDGGTYLEHAGVDAVFAFPLERAIRSFDKDKIVAALASMPRVTPAGRYQLVFVENHDLGRVASDAAITPEKLRTAATLSLLADGVPVVYYGQELGMRGAPRPGLTTDEKDIGQREAFKWSARIDAPGQANWYRGPGISWTGKFARDDDGISVAEQQHYAGSLLAHYRAVLRLRHQYVALATGTQAVLDSAPGVLVIERASGTEHLRVVANLTDHPVYYVLAAADRVLLRGATRARGRLRLAPYQASVICRG
jgi:glycosidase